MKGKGGLGGFGRTATTGQTAHPFLADEIARRGAIPGGLTWHFCRPPVVDLDYEMEVRGLGRELAL